MGSLLRPEVVVLVRSSLATTVWTKRDAQVTRVSGSKPWAGIRYRRSSKSADDIHYKSPDAAVIEACLNCPYDNCTGNCRRIKEIIKENHSSKHSRLVKRGKVPDDFAESYIAGASRRELSEKYQVADATIGRWMKKLGLGRGSVKPKNT